MNTTHTKKQNAFSLVELLMVLTIMSIMAALIINSFSNAAQDTRDVIARQQQATLKSALDNMLSQYMVTGHSVEQARKHYMYLDSTAAPARTMKQRLVLLADYLDEGTYQHFLDSTTNTHVKSDAMVKTQQYILFEAWAPATQLNRNTYPKVTLTSL